MLHCVESSEAECVMFIRWSQKHSDLTEEKKCCIHCRSVLPLSIPASPPHSKGRDRWMDRWTDGWVDGWRSRPDPPLGRTASGTKRRRSWRRRRRSSSGSPESCWARSSWPPGSRSSGLHAGAPAPEWPGGEVRGQHKTAQMRKRWRWEEVEL